MTKHKNEHRNETQKKEASHLAWELEVQTEGLDELQGESLEKESKTNSKSTKV